MEVLGSHGEISPVHAVVHLRVLVSPLIIVTQLALKLQEASLIESVLLSVKHIVALRAEAHSLELGSSLLGLGIIVYILRRQHLK